ncbi:MAG: hypothetical protein R2881_04465 [Eubacteriales bacterium]
MAACFYRATTQEAQPHQSDKARILMHDFAADLSRALDELELHSYYEKVSYLCERGLYGRYILEGYTKEELDEAGTFIDPRTTKSSPILGLELLPRRYVIRSHKGLRWTRRRCICDRRILPYRRSGIASRVKHFYDMLSTLKVTMATPTLANARKLFHQLSKPASSTPCRTA